MAQAARQAEAQSRAGLGMKIKGRIVEISITADGTTLFIVGNDENGIGRRVEVPLAPGRNRFRPGDEAEIQIDGPPDYFLHPAPKTLQ